MKLIVQIPCYNEEATIGAVLADIPRRIPGISVVETLVIDGGSTDDTIAAARAAGVDHVVRQVSNRGLASGFAAGIEACLHLGADIIVNTDGDNQYDGASIPDLVRPIVEGRAEVVVGDRRTSRIEHFSKTKKTLQVVGSAVVRAMSGLRIGDAVSGFRAYDRATATSMNVLSTFSYTVETLIQAGCAGRKVVSVPVGTNPKTRESRLFKSIPSFLRKQVTTMVRSYAMYRPLRTFSAVGAGFCLLGLLPLARFLLEYVRGDGDGHVQSLVIGGMFFTIGFLLFAIAMLADVLSMNRRLIEANLVISRRLEHRLLAIESGERTVADTPSIIPNLVPAE